MLVMKKTKKYLIFISFLLTSFIFIIFYVSFKSVFISHVASYALDNNWSAQDAGTIGGLIWGIPYGIMGLSIFLVFKKLFLNKKITSKFNDAESGVEMSLEDETLDISYEKQFYNAAFDEITTGNIDGGIWAMAFAQSMGDEKEAQARYIKVRSADIKTLFEESEKFKKDEELSKRYNSKRVDSNYNRSLGIFMAVIILIILFGSLISS